jgi:hypothetical protein
MEMTTAATRVLFLENLRRHHLPSDSISGKLFCLKGLNSYFWPDE